MSVDKNAIPAKILDLHTHLFNARYMPLGRVIADKMGKSESKLADITAKLLWHLTGSKSSLLAKDAHVNERAVKNNETFVDLIWAVADFELAAIPPEPIDPQHIKNFSLEHGHSKVILESKLAKIIDRLNDIAYEDEGLDIDALMFIDENLLTPKNLSPNIMSFKFNTWEKAVKKALHAVSKLCENVEDGGDFIEFLWTMLHAEEVLFEKLTDSYGMYKDKMRFVHFMMDMEKAYKQPAKVYYPFFPQQLQNMKKLQLQHPEKIIGFSAFDPRRDNWENIADASNASGFSGYKFYPAMGYLPYEDSDLAVRDRIDKFFAYCVERDRPIFVHCTPIGFETKEHYGLNTHPKHWANVLLKFPDLRLCFGHAGGGQADRDDAAGKKKYYGWTAKTSAQWEDPDNFARIIATLCTQYKNVYCEVAYIIELLQGEDWVNSFITNLETARKNTGQYDLMKKIAYGSDWDMPSMVDHTLPYLEVFLNIFSKPEYTPYRERFFSETGYEFLNQS
jgi:predicted TIM-barrel fold metal-dependent hydrolase